MQMQQLTVSQHMVLFWRLLQQVIVLVFTCLRRPIHSKTGLTLGAEYYLAATPGAITVTAPSATGNIVQRIGIADKTTEIVFVPYTTIEIA
jgi:hypothetical protein